ncbi:MAG TPA: ABC transporter permease, partial [Chitinophagaceae bacterium]|nr:ABC transporter permease [Chitinophagaceae bacterium]
SVKPTQLMTGKIIGIGAVGLTQFIIWIILAIIGIYFFGNFSQQLMSNMSPMGGAQESGQVLIILQQLKGLIAALPVVEIVLCFLFYFFGGYLLYAALYAAVGSAVDQEMTESQSLTLPITMPIIISFFIMFGAIQNPNSTLAVVCSIFPLSSPIVMMARIPYGIPAWQLILSILLLIATIWLTIRIAGKIYRTGILLYGKKVTIKEMTKWLFRKS